MHHIVIDARDLPALAHFWAEALRWRVLSSREREIVVGADDSAPIGLCFMPSPDDKTSKNRVHLDLTTEAHDRSDNSGSSREPSSSVGIPNAAGSGAGWAKYSSVNSPCHDVIAMKAAMPAPDPPAR